MAIVAPIPLDPSQVEDAAGVLVRSFADDPGLRFVLPNLADRDRLGPTEADLAEIGLAAVPGQIGPDAWWRFRRLLDHLDRLHPRYAPEPHRYLALPGVDRAWQRQGIGESLMRSVFAADCAGRCYLEASTAGNARYCERRGFRVVAETDIPDSDVHIWLMRWEPVVG